MPTWDSRPAVIGDSAGGRRRQGQARCARRQRRPSTPLVRSAWSGNYGWKAELPSTAAERQSWWAEPLRASCGRQPVRGQAGMRKLATGGAASGCGHHSSEQGISRKSESSPRRASEPAVRRAQDLFSLNARNSGRRDRDRVLVVPMLRAFVDQDRASQSSNRNPGVSTGDASSANRNGDEKGQNQTREGRSAR